MITEFDIDKAEYFAFNEAILRSTVGIAINDNTSIGTGIFVSFRGERFVLTAAHVIQGVSLSKIRYFVPPSTSLRELSMRNVFQFCESAHTGEAFKIADGAIIDDLNDLAAIPLHPLQSLPSHVHFVPVEDCLDTIRNGASILIVGFPVANSALVENAEGLTRALGITSEHATYREELQTRCAQSLTYDPEVHFLIEYSRMEDGIRPSGFSGAAAWCSLSPRSSIWTAVPAFVGVVIRWHRETKENPHMLQIIKASFVKEWFDRRLG